MLRSAKKESVHADTDFRCEAIRNRQRGQDGTTACSSSVSIFDLDGTLIRGDSYLSYLIRYLRRSPLRCFWALQLPLAVLLFYAGQRDNTWLKVAFLRAVLGGLTRLQIDAWSETFLDHLMANSLRSDALVEIERRRRGSETLVLASASPDIYVVPLARRLGFDYVVCTRVAWDERGRLSGALDGPNCYGATKRDMVAALLKNLSPVDKISVYTDHHSDLPLLQSADHPVAVCPTPTLRATAKAYGFAIQDWN
jgi:HAD superfamily hydrolase (TIGR01490 family)